jgi:ribosome-binding protein aMBF1 (putative translation factor)
MMLLEVEVERAYIDVCHDQVQSLEKARTSLYRRTAERKERERIQLQRDLGRSWLTSFLNRLIPSPSPKLVSPEDEAVKQMLEDMDDQIESLEDEIDEANQYIAEAQAELNEPDEPE